MVTSYDVRKIILEQSKRAHVGHIGSALCIVEILASLYGGILRIENPQDVKRDRFVLSKGHAALALYAVLYLKGFISQKELDAYCSDNSLLGVHPEHALKGVDFSTGSLGQGLSMGVGAALAARLNKQDNRTFVLISDAECNEGAVWEAVMVAAQHKLSNLIAIIDLNGQQAFGYSKDVIDLTPMKQKWESFGWDAYEVDGHDEIQIKKTIEQMTLKKDKPHVLIAKTVFGKGVSFMENKIKWHYWPMSDDEYKLAIKELT